MSNLRRNSEQVTREESKRILEDPAFQKIIADEEKSLCAKIANHVADGSEESDRAQLQWCQDLQAMMRIKRRLFSQGAQLNERQGEPKDE